MRGYKGSVKERFERKYIKTNYCWEWTAGKCSKGYGTFWYQNHVVGAHRVSWALYRGKIPEGMHVLHKCDNPACVNPDHLFLGSNADNMQDRQNKGRQARGERTGTTKYDEALVATMRNIYSTGEFSMRAIGRLVGIPEVTAIQILRGKTWQQ